MVSPVNAACSLSVPTPDGSGQAVHPDVVYVPDGHLGYAYWMACTPYPFGIDTEENPIIRVSHDGIDWIPFPGAPDPLVSKPGRAGWHHADTDLVLHNGSLHVFYISTATEGAGTTFSVISSTDGCRWTEPCEIYSAAWGVSPAVVVDDRGHWDMWYIYLDTLDPHAESQLLRRAGESPLRFGDVVACTLEIEGHRVWHIDVVAVGAGFEALVTAFPRNADPSVSRLFHAYSPDGLDWRLSRVRPLLSRSSFGWDNRMIYRSTFIKRGDGTYRIWYSACSWGMRCGIGYVEGPLDALSPLVGQSTHSAGLAVRIREDAAGLAKYGASRLLPATIYAQLAAARRHFSRGRR